MSDRNYFATLPSESIGTEIVRRAQQYYANTRVMEILAKQRVAFRYYYDLGLNWAGWGTPGTTNMMQRGGEEGELALIRINHARNLARGQIAMVSNAKFDRRPRASSDDYDALQATQRCSFVLDHYRQSGKLEQRRIDRIESATVLGEGFTHYAWSDYLGKRVGVDPATKKPAYTGDAYAENLLSWDVIRDPFLEWDAQQHVTLHFPRVNRWNLAAQFPKFAEKIKDAPSQTVIPFFTPVATTSDGPTPDHCEVFRFYHAPSPVLPAGRDVLVLADFTVLSDTELEWDRIPLARVAEAGVMGSPFGYPSFWEYLGVQELYDNLQSVVATNQSTFGAQNLAIRTGVDPRPIQLGGGMSAIVCDDPEKDIKPLQLTKSPAEVFPHMDSLLRNMERLSGQSQVDRGEAQGDRQSGAALALLSANSLRNASPYQESDKEALKDESQILLRILRKKAKRPITIGVSERGETPYELAILGHQLGNVDAVDIELANPLQQTTEGRIAILQTFAQLKIPLNPDQAMEVITSGRLEPVTDSATREGNRIRLENKRIAQGQQTRALLSDDHVRHCTEHTMVMSDAGRDDKKVQAAWIAHVEEHYELFYGTPPRIPKMQPTFAPNGVEVLGPDGQPQMQPVIGPDGQPVLVAEPLYRVRMMALCGVTPPPPGPEQGPPPPPQGGPGPSAPSPEQEALALPPGNPKAGALPSLPTNPQTGGRYNPQTATPGSA